MGKIEPIILNKVTNHRMFYDAQWLSQESLNRQQIEKICEFNENIFAGNIEMNEAPCICGATAFDLVSNYDRFRVWRPIVICRTCGLMQCQPQLSDESLKWFYESDFYRTVFGNPKRFPMDDEKFAAHVSAGRCICERITSIVDLVHFNSVAEVGCGGGWNLQPFQDAGKTVFGVDYSPRLTEFGRGRGLDLAQGGIDQYVNRGHEFDLVILSHVLEHVPNVMEFLGDICSRIKDGGYVYIEVPDGMQFCMGSLQTAHIYYFSSPYLQAIGSKVGLETIHHERIGPFFYVLFKKTNVAVEIPFPNEYDVVRQVIRNYERRETLKDVLKFLGIFKVLRFLVHRYRNLRAS